jgi:ribosome-associated protein
MLDVDGRVRVPESEFRWSFARAGGPGGQNVNKVASKAVLRWDVAGSASLPGEIKTRLFQQQRRRITSAGELVLYSQRFRDQERNRQDCLEKLRDILRQAAKPPKQRKPVKQPQASREARHRAKHYRARIKAGRRAPGAEPW